MDYPRLRYIEAFPVEEEGKPPRIYIRDPLDYAKTPLLLPYPTYFIISHFDGQHSLIDIQEAFAKQFGQVLSREMIADLARQLDEQYYLDSPRFTDLQEEIHTAFLQSSVREMAHADTCYSSQPQTFREQAASFFSHAEGPGTPAAHEQTLPPIRGLIAPHIDLRVGGTAYAWSYKELAERCDADLFILLGTSHYGAEDLFVATDKDYNTPLGRVKTDRDFIRTLQQNYDEDLLASELLHRTEHSLEFQTLFLQYVLGNHRPFTIVPLLVTSFHHMILSNTPPVEIPRVATFLSALKKTIAQSQKKVCFVAGVDFAHVGQKFGDQGPLTQEFLNWVESEDRRLIQALENVDHADFFAQIAKDGDRRRVCGFAPMYTLLHLVEATRGKLLKYAYAETAPHSAVSFASLAFY
ncbi:MAG: AmmeMemoRadiSam system protein B [Candidatus Binatia bacterium]